SHTSQPSSTIIAVQVAGTEHHVDISKIPYFAAQLRFETAAGTITTTSTTTNNNPPQPPKLIHNTAIPFFDAINHSVQHGLRHLFRRMPLPPNLADYQVLCSTLDYLLVAVIPHHQTLKDIVRALKTGDDDYDCDERREIRGDKRGARDAAFQLLYLLLMG
ncbi:hypothetical protein B0T24DRAFT_511850, partial [Lasiosphaeria ovina]